MSRKLSWEHPIYIPKAYWEPLSEEKFEEFVSWIFQYYREDRGFPYYILSDKEKVKDFNKLIDYDFVKVLDGKIIKQTMHGLGLAWSYFPHAWNVKCKNMRTPYEVFHNDELFRKAIERRLKRGVFMTDAGMRKGLKSFTGTQAVSNFRPTAAGAIYEHYAGDGVVWDMSAGFGGRLIGALTSNRVKKYIGTDPSTKTFVGLMKIKKDYSRFFKDRRKEIELLMIGSENYIPDENTLDLCFTSPPYFDVEKYSNESTQSYLKFPTRNEWFNGFLDRTIVNCMHGLKDGGYIIFNIAKVSSYPKLEEDLLLILERERNLKPIDRLDYLLSSITRGGYKSESVYVFKIKK